MTSRHTNIRLLFSLGAALPFSQDPGLQPVFTWSASLACGHFLGHLFRHLAGAGHQEEVEEARDDSQEQVVATPTPEPCQRQRRPHENTPRGRMVRNTRQRMQDKRQKHLRKGSFQKLRDKNSSEPAEPVPDYRGILPVTEDRLLSEAARTLDNICSDYLCSLERKKNGDCDDRKLSRLKTLSTVDQTDTSQEYKVAVQSLQMLDLHKSQDDNDIQSSL